MTPKEQLAEEYALKSPNSCGSVDDECFQEVKKDFLAGYYAAQERAKVLVDFLMLLKSGNYEFEDIAFHVGETLAKYHGKT